MKAEIRNDDVLAHYIRLWGKPSRKFNFAHPSQKTPGPFLVYEFAGNANDPSWVYATLGVSRSAMTHPTHEPARMELYLLSNFRQDELVNTLGAIAVYPFIHQTYFGEGHTVHGDGDGVVAKSPLTDLLITRADYGEIPDFVTHADESHTHLFWVVPIYPSEREFAVERGWQSLEALFDEKQIDVLDFQRSAVV